MTKYDRLMEKIKVGTAPPTTKNVMRARNLLRMATARTREEAELIQTWLKQLDQ